MRNTRLYIVLILFILSGIGLVMIYSSSAVYSWNYYKDSLHFFKKHFFYLIIGVILMVAAMLPDHRLVRKAAKPLFFISLMSLMFVFIPGVGHEASGAQRWIRIAGFGFQPSELVKITFILYLADFISRRKKIINNFFYGLMPVSLILGFTVLLFLLQPDLGMSVVLVVVTAVVLFCAGLSYRYFLSVGLLSIPVLYFLVFSVPYRRARILAFLDPWSDPKGIGFQVIQSQIALAYGGIFGQGLGQSKQKLFYLPAAHTDFIFSVITEEIGLIGALVVIFLFILLLWQMVKIVRFIQDDFLCFFSIGVVTMIAFEVVVNIGVCIGSLPTKGLPLPFISYGGSSLIFDMISIGLLLNASRNRDIYESRIT